MDGVVGRSGLPTLAELEADPVTDRHRRHIVVALRGLRLSLLLPLALITFPALLALSYITAFGVNLPYWDDFALITYLESMRSGALTFQALLAQHNEHRIFFPRLVMLATAQLTHFNTKAEMYLYWLCLCCICITLFFVFRRARGISFQSLMLFAPVTYIVFSLRQWDSLLWGWEICWAMLVLFALLAIYFLQVRALPGLSFPLSLVSAVIASFSLAGGLFVWPVGFLEIVYLSRAREGQHFVIPRIAAWLAVGLVVFAAYFHSYVRPENVESPLSTLLHPVSAVPFFLAVLGEPLALDAHDAAGIGLLLVCLFAYAILRGIRRGAAGKAALWLAMMLLSIMFASAVALGRSQFPLNAAAVPRYSVLGMLGIAGLYLWLATNRPTEDPRRNLIWGATLGLLVVGSVAVYSDGLAQGHAESVQRRTLAGYARNFETETDAHLLLLFPFLPAYTRYELAYLNSERLSIFSGSKVAPVQQTEPDPSTLVVAGDGTGFSLDTVNVGLSSRALDPRAAPIVTVDLAADDALGIDDVVTVSGWAVDSANRTAAGGVWIDIDGRTDIPARYGISRPDVGAVLQNDAYSSSGYEAAFQLRPLGKGRHILSVKIVTADKMAYYWPAYRVILDVH